MNEAHAVVGQVAIVLGLIAALWSIALVVTRRSSGTLYLGNLVWLFGAIAIAAVLGGASVITAGELPADVLHILYGVLALGVLPGVAIISSGRDARARSIVAAIGAIVLVVLLARLLQTG